MRGLKRWAALLGIISLLTVVILAGSGFALAQWDDQPSEEEDGGSGDGFPSLTPQDIIDYIVDWLQGDDPAPPEEDEVEDPVSDEEQSPAAQEPEMEEVPPADTTSPTPQSDPESEPRETDKETPKEAADPAQALQEGLEERVEYMGSISGCKFLDANCNGCRDEGEPGIAGVGIHLEDGCKDWCAITAEDGSYAFTGLEPGSYEVEVIEKTVPAGHFH
ncbi:MAG: hypothetical protein JW854_16775, partial [Actinobacteria bacterium]|nr:hypothetical protein [Actinomycetota bacterium]